MSRPHKPASGPAVNEQPRGWDRLSNAWQHAVCLAVLATISLSFFAPLHFGGKSLIGSDTVNWRATAESVKVYERDSGEPALWATNVFGGMPAYMISYRNAVPQIDTFLSQLRRVFWPSSHFLVLLFGTYLLAYFVGRLKWAAVLAAVAFGLTTYMPVILVAGHNTKFIALCYSPWLLLSFAYAVRRPGVLASLLFAIVLALHLRAGHFQITYYVLVVMLVWWLGEGIEAVRAGSTSQFVSSTLTLLAGGALAGMMVAQPYLVQFEYKEFTIRGAGPGGEEGGLAWDYAMGWSQGIGEMITLVVADAYGGSDAYWGAKPFTGGPHYLTAIVTFLAVVGAFRERTVVARSLGVAAVLLVIFALGSNLALVNRPMFNFFPLFDAFRVPETWLSVLALVAAVLAVLGLKSILENPPSISLRSSLVVRWFVGFAVVLFLMAVASDTVLDFERTGERESVIQQIARGNGVSPDDPRVARTADEYLTEMRADRRDRFSADAWRSLIMLVLAGGAFLLYRRGRFSSTLVQITMVLLVLADLWTVDRRYFNDSKLTRSAEVESAIPEYAFDRFLIEERMEASDPFRVLSLEGNPTTTARPSFFHESLSGYHGAKLRLYQDFLDEVLIGPDGALNLQALRMMNARYVVARGEVPEANRVFTDEQTGFSVFEVRGSLPRAFFVDSLIAVPSSEAAWSALADRSLDLGRVAIVSEELAVPPSSRDSLDKPTAEVTSYSPRRIEVRGTTDRERLLVLSEVYYPAGWTATIDGAVAEIHRVNYLLRGVVVPPGAHEIVFEFDPASHHVGLWVAGASTLLVYGLAIILLGLGAVRSRSAVRDPSST